MHIPAIVEDLFVCLNVFFTAHQHNMAISARDVGLKTICFINLKIKRMQ